MCVLFAGLGFIGVRVLFAAREQPPRIVSLLFMAFAVTAISGTMWFQRRMICGFDYDGGTLRFRTLGVPQTQVRPFSDIQQVKDWRGRGGPIGYILVFHNAGKLYLEYSVSNSIALAEQLRWDGGR